MSAVTRISTSWVTRRSKVKSTISAGLVPQNSAASRASAGEVVEFPGRYSVTEGINPGGMVESRPGFQASCGRSGAIGSPSRAEGTAGSGPCGPFSAPAGSRPAPALIRRCRGRC